MNVMRYSIVLAPMVLLSACASGTAQETAPATLDASYWRVDQIEGVDLAYVEQDRRPTLHFDATAQRVDGSGGCNRYSGSYQDSDGKLGFGPMMQTKMGCEEPVGSTEQKFQAALSKVAKQRVDDNHLELLDADGKVVLRLQADAPSSD